MRRCVSIAACLLLSGVLLVAQGSSPEAPPDRPPFDQWLAGIREEALARGIRTQVVDEALGAVQPVEIVLQRDRTQAEFTLSLDRYLRRRITAGVVRTAREMLNRHRTVLAPIAHKYGVQPEVLIAVWGLESNFGRFAGVRPTIPVLATLAWDPRRATFFRGQLFDALEILNRRDIELSLMRGSWAGAMGQVQFMPSSYLQYAVDFDGDGRRDIWTTPADVFASIANYLSKNGWEAGERWGREVSVSKAVAARIANRVSLRDGGCRANREMTGPQLLSAWSELGVRLPGGRPLPRVQMEASLVRAGTRHFLVYGNYEALLEYNCAHSYALSIGILSDRLGSSR